MERPPTRSLLDLPRPTARGRPGRGLLRRLSLFLPWDLTARGDIAAFDSGRRESFITAREFFLSVLILGLLAVWVLEFAPMLHAVHAVRSAATVAANLAATGSGGAGSAARGWMDDLPGAGRGELSIRRLGGPGGDRVEAVARLDYYPSTPVVRAFLPRVIRLEAVEERDMEQ
ncbi:MAG: hypothetical protein AB1916_08710 [Thermodesulfobacteriota bacterium]